MTDETTIEFTTALELYREEGDIRDNRRFMEISRKIEEQRGDS